MQIKFENTYNIDKSLYEKLILGYIYDHYHYKDYKKYQIQDNWTITIKRVQDFDRGFYSLSGKTDDLDYSIPHGVTGQRTVICYITDSDNPLILLQNMTVICHELAHMILMVYYPDKITLQRYDDFYGKTGTQRKFFSSEVHDRLAEGKIRTLSRRLGFRKTIRYVGVDITDITNSRNEDKGF